MQRRRNNGLFWGIALITFGLLIVARRADWIDFDWHSLANFWPVLLILAGVNLILERRGNAASLVTTVLLAVAVPFTLFGLFSRDRDDNRYEFRWNDHDDDDDNKAGQTDDDHDDNASDSDQGKVRSSTFTEVMEPDTREAVLKLAGGAGRFTISEPTSELIKADTRQTIGNYSMTVERDPTTRIPTIELKPAEENQKIRLKDGDFENRVDVHLNDKPLWTIDVGLGAGDADLDLSQYAIKELKVGVGASDLDLKLGAKANQMDVKLDAGVASVTVEVPKEVGCRIKKDGALNVNQLEGFTETADGEFVSPGYDTATKKINIRFDGGVSSFTVKRY